VRTQFGPIWEAIADGVRYSFPGDMATIAADGTLVLFGRGSNGINTGGEKVYPEEVEAALKGHPAVEDALVFGVPDDRFGQRVVGIVAPQSWPLDDGRGGHRRRPPAPVELQAAEGAAHRHHHPARPERHSRLQAGARAVRRRAGLTRPRQLRL
jgi:acyl-CoA synthetase (AMP-forming)/AMP-acid ligase II